MFDHSLIAAQYDGWLAASILKLPVCMKVKTIGKAIQTLQCVKTKLFLLRLLLLLKVHNLFMLRNKDSVVNFNGVPYGSSYKTRKKLSVSEIEPHQEIIHKFRYIYKHS